MLKNLRGNSQQESKNSSVCFSKPQSLLLRAKAPRAAAASSVPSRLRRGPPRLHLPVPVLHPAVPGARPSLPPRASSCQSPRALLPWLPPAGLAQRRAPPPPGRRSVRLPAQADVQAPQSPLNTVAGLFTMSPVRCGHLAMGLALGGLQAWRACHPGWLRPLGGATAGRVSADRPVPTRFLHPGLSLQYVCRASPGTCHPSGFVDVTTVRVWPSGGLSHVCCGPCISDALAHLPFGLGLGHRQAGAARRRGLVVRPSRAASADLGLLLGAPSARACPLPP